MARQVHSDRKADDQQHDEHCPASLAVCRDGGLSGEGVHEREDKQDKQRDRTGRGITARPVS